MLLLVTLLLSMLVVRDAFTSVLGRQRHNLARYLQQKARPEAATAATTAATAEVTRDGQTLEFIEPSTGTRVVLVGSMHYNPHSIELASRTIEKLGRDGTLGSVIVESCATRARCTLTPPHTSSTLLHLHTPRHTSTHLDTPRHTSTHLDTPPHTSIHLSHLRTPQST
jgi:hypothetical protein